MAKGKGINTISISVIISIVLFITFAKFTIAATIFTRTVALAFTIGAIFFAIKSRKNFKITSLVAMSMSFYVVWFGISTLYANAGKFAINEYIKILIGFSLFIFIIYSKRDKITLNNTLWCTTSLAAVITFLSIEGASLGVIEPMFENFFYGGMVTDYATFNGERISSIYGITNAFATIMGVTLFLSLYLYLNAENKMAKAIQALYMILFANGIFLVFSMGGTFSLAVSVVAFLFFAKGETRIHGLLIVIQVALIAIVGVILTLGTYVSYYLSDVSSGSPLPLVAVIAGGVVFFAIDNIICSRLTEVLLKYEKLVYGFFVIMIIVSIVGGFFVFSKTSSSVISTTDIYSRTVYLEAGEYEIDVELENDASEIRFQVYTKNLEQVILGTNTSVIYERNLKNADEPLAFVVPEDNAEVYIRIQNVSDKSLMLNKIEFIGESGSEYVNLSYKYLPDNITSRLQGLRTNYSLMTRIQYVKDGWTLFLQSPILGHGLGGFENAVQSVQKYQYETKYAHNHFIQTMVDGGIIGFVAYVSLIISCIFVLIKSRKTNEMAPMLFSALTMIVVHGATEFSMSIEQFVPFAFIVFALISATADKEINKISKYNDKILISMVSTISLFVVFLAGNIIANVNINSNSVTLNTLTTNASIDIYEKNDYKLSYVLATSGIDDATMRATSNKYLASLEKAKSNTISLYLAKYYVENFYPEKSYEQIVNYIDYSLYDPDTWNMAFNQYIGALQDASNVEHFYQYKDEYIEIINDLIVKLGETNKSSISQITLDDYSLMYVRNILASADIETSEEFLNYVDTVIYDSQYDTSINDNGAYDALISSNTNFDIKENITNSGNKVRIKVPYTYYATYKIIIESENVSKITSPTDEVAFAVTDEGKTVVFLDTTSATDGYVDVIVAFDGDDAELGGIIISR
ncbi:MAG: O-antigen ligase family protein [Clostridia bacterium]